MSGYFPVILMFVVTCVGKMACRACFKSGHCHGKGNDQHFYLWSQAWYLWNFAQQVFFQRRWPQTIKSQENGHPCTTLLLGIWPIPVKTSGDFNFIDFWLDLTDFATTYEIMLIQNWRFLKIREFKKERIDKTTTGIILYDSYTVYDIHVKKNR